jgi:Signal peptidase, peptidase S26
MSGVPAYRKDWKKALFAGAVLALVLTAAIHIIGSRWVLCFNVPGNNCLGKQYHFWIVRKGVMPKRWQYIAFTSRGIPHCTDGTLWAKQLVGIPGDRIEAVRVSKEERAEKPGKYKDTVYLNGMPIETEVQGYVSIIADGREIATYTAYATDTHRRPLPMITSRIIPKGELFVAGSPRIKRSYDSRYWGLIDEKNVVGEPEPVF